MEIKVKPEQLEQIAKNISEMQTHSQNIQQNLTQSMFSIQLQWQGATSQHFYGEYMRSMRLMESYIRNLQVTEKELRRIAQKFRQADEEYQKKQNEKLKEAHKKEKKHEKSWWEKGIEGAAEFIGVNDAIRAVTGKDPITGKELSSKERLIAAGWTLLNFVPVGKVASLAGKGIKYVASSFGKTIVKAGKRLGEGVTMVAGKAAVDGIKTASHKVTEGVNFVASTAKGFADKIGSLWNKGATTVKTTFLQGNEKIQHAVKTLMDYKWIPGEGKGFAMAGVGKVSGGGQYSLKEAYQYMASKVVKGTGDVGDKASGANIKKLDDFSGPLENGPYIKNGKPRGRPQLSGEKKLGFEKDVFNKQIDPDGILRDPNTSETIDWKPGRPRKGKVDFGHTEGNSYKKMFEKYKHGEITLEELKEFQFNPDNFRLETPSANRSHKYE
ncbi:WXG100 family type VII secretion target [Bacillus paranthracis]|uniref:WXG100 family type VII secretion target n=4 Tax=Bacillus paranthracis TaxID=2026186 RepID=UPI0015C4EDED|nr:WXG100 family type VII secretion target [Bacillus paranthracis]MCR6798258.1 WXG100 family type VII secretion target [Bacillus paranthracis]MEC3356695.1 WXG100 family type VII secretion target [Bacillus paranthracis]MED0786753.1 WXG100 family type VII secretion target [Bacillus paranthracis]MED1161442.1 WXG100 family type VII secretion target [Bacillus paranthracis]MED1181180.1 WXG100 family type VII secretion target [Bacillus paranthracis]